MAVQSRMMVCLSVAMLAASLGRCGTLAAQNEAPARSNDPLAQPIVANPASTEADSSSAIPEPRRFPSPLPAAALRPAGGTDSPYTIPAARGGVGANASLQQLEERVMAVQKLEKQINVLFPGSKVHVIALADRVIVKGSATSEEEQARILQIVGSGMNKFFNEGPSASGSTLRQVSAEQQDDFIVNMLNSPPFSVALNVKIVELDQKKMRDLGFDFESLKQGTVSTTTESQLETTESAGGLLEASEADGLIKGLVEAGVAKVLALPTLTVESGHTASYLAGGEFPVPTIVGIGGAQGTSTSFTGSGPTFLLKPEIIDASYIKLEITPEYSNLQSGESNGGVPSVKVQRSTTKVKMREGHSFVLISRRDESVEPSIQSIPFLKDLTFIGGTLRVQKLPTSKPLLLVITPTIELSDDSTETPQPTEQHAAQPPRGGIYSDPLAPFTGSFGPGYAPELSIRVPEISPESLSTLRAALYAAGPPPFGIYPVQSPQPATSFNTQPLSGTFNPAPAPTGWTERVPQLQDYSDPFRPGPLPPTMYRPTPLQKSPYPHPQPPMWKPVPSDVWSSCMRLPRLTHLESALASLNAAGLTKEAAAVQAEIAKEKQAQQLRNLEQKKRELQALQAEIDALTQSLPRPEKEKESATHFRLDTLILSSTIEELRRAGLVQDEATGGEAFPARILGVAADTLLERCKQAVDTKVLGSSTQLVANGERTIWQNGVDIEIAVPPILQTKGSSKQKLSTGFRLVGSDIALTPTQRFDGRIILDAVLEFSSTGNSERGIIQVGDRSVPKIYSHRTRSDVTLSSGQTILFGMPQNGDSVVVIAVKVSAEY